MCIFYRNIAKIKYKIDSKLQKCQSKLMFQQYRKEAGYSNKMKNMIAFCNTLMAAVLGFIALTTVTEYKAMLWLSFR